MKLIVGLGNPGPQYDRTRHNAGFMVIDHLAARCAIDAIPKARFKSLTVEAMIPTPDDKDRLPGPGSGAQTEKCLLMKPTTFMNLSGQAVSEAVRFYKLDPTQDVLVITDDVALPCGSIRLRAKGGSGGHNGLTNIQTLLGTNAYPRLRIGIDPPGTIPQVDYVLGKFSPEQQAELDKALPRAAACAALWAHEGDTAAMNRYNAPTEPKPKKPKPKPEPTPDATGTDPISNPSNEH